jgi:acetyltransferase-like isoleucine patch superfamily enzyme
MIKLIHFFWKIFLKITHPSCTIKAAEIGRNTKLQEHVTLEQGSYVYTKSVGKYTFINKYCLIDKSVESIGSFCSIAYGCKIGLANHPVDWVSTHPFAYDKKYGFVEKNKFSIMSTAPKCKIGNDVWIGANAIILAGVTVGDGAIIGANAFINKDVEAYSIVTGTPAKHQKYRFDNDTVDQLKKIEWWKWSDKKIKENIELFNQPEQFVKEKF